MSHFDLFQEPIVQLVKARVSCRTYENRLLTEQDKGKLLAFCGMIKRGFHGEKIVFHLVEHDTKDLKGRKLAGYGLFRNARSCVIGVIDKSDMHHVSYGYAMEHVVLKATELGLGTCWAGYFDPYLTKDVPVSDNQLIPAICLVGYTAEKQTFFEKVARSWLRASKRKNWDRLFFHGNFHTPLIEEYAAPYTEALELVRLAPSSGNTQPWRIIMGREKNIFHFFKNVVNERYEKKKLHDIDIGIAMCHFELGAAKNRLPGEWQRIEPAIRDIPNETHYIISWFIR